MTFEEWWKHTQAYQKKMHGLRHKKSVARDAWNYCEEETTQRVRREERELVMQAAISDLCPICAGGGEEPVYHSQSNGWYHLDGPPGNWCMAGRVRSMVRVIKEADDDTRT